MRNLKKLGNKIYTISVKIQECQEKGMESRVPTYIEQLEEAKRQISVEVQKLKTEYKLNQEESALENKELNG